MVNNAILAVPRRGHQMVVSTDSDSPVGSGSGHGSQRAGMHLPPMIPLYGGQSNCGKAGVSDSNWPIATSGHSVFSWHQPMLYPPFPDTHREYEREQLATVATQ
jgi:hypothetical protein